MVIAEVSIFPLGTGEPGVSEYVAAAVRELEASGLKCTLGPMGTTVEAETPEEAYAAIARAQTAVLELGVGRTYTVVKMDERRDVGGRSTEDMMRSVRESSDAR
ncbi:MAG TPA: MTH1187 family thiamine-binding protein [Rubrobacteraceae bacterium]|nr:MTH1187 family thiamine-binding protein [Rubrobacteraceae bacterium]